MILSNLIKDILTGFSIATLMFGFGLFTYLFFATLGSEGSSTDDLRYCMQICDNNVEEFVETERCICKTTHGL